MPRRAPTRARAFIESTGSTHGMRFRIEAAGERQAHRGHEGQRRARARRPPATALMAKAWLHRPWSSRSRITSTPSRSAPAPSGRSPRAARRVMPSRPSVTSWGAAWSITPQRPGKNTTSAMRLGLEPGRGHRHRHGLGRRAKRGRPRARRRAPRAGPARSRRPRRRARALAAIDREGQRRRPPPRGCRSSRRPATRRGRAA